MAASEPTLHVMFNPSAAGTLQYTLNAIGSDDRVVRLLDDFSFGSIADDCPATRAAWVEEKLGYCDWIEVSERNAAVIEAAVVARGPVIAWYSPNIASVAAGFLWWLSAIGDTPCRVVCAPDILVLKSEKLAELLRSDVALSDADRAAYDDQWRRLKAEDASLRVIENGSLVSASITYFDRALLGHASSEWRNMARIVGTILGDEIDAGVRQASDLVLAARLSALAEGGVLEWRGDLSRMTACDVRLPPRQA